MDAFYAAVEVRDDPTLAGLPLIIGHRGRRGVVSTCSYEARKFGVRSAMPSVTAERLCPQATWLPGRMEQYAAVSRRIRRIMEDATPTIEPISIDEAFLDMTGVVSPAGGPARRPITTLEEGARVAAWLKERIRAAERLTASVGVAPNKFLAKVASDLEKPDGLVVLSAADVPARLWPMPVERLWGVGPKTAPRLRGAGMQTVGDVARRPVGDLEAILGEGWGASLQALARGEDDREVSVDREARSISEERTYEEDLRDPDAIDRALLARAEGVAQTLRHEGLVARTVHIKVRTGDFTTWTRAHTLPAPTDLAEILVRAARDLFRERIRLGRMGIRLLGVGVSGISATEASASGAAGNVGAQANLFPDPEEERARKATRAADAVRAKLGDAAITRARLLGRKRDAGETSGASPSRETRRKTRSRE